jgi:NAD(P)-dependent dehydrogenase (short-subunit alcohol dehydrogenase family)
MSDRPVLDFSDKIILVTGASRGIGEATARLMAGLGGHVIVSSRRQQSVDEVAASIRAAGHQATGLACHVGDPEAVETAFAQIVEQFGRLDVLVNNAATHPHFGHIAETPLSMVDKTIDVNIRGYFQMSQKAALMMRDSGGGAIVNISSINGRVPGPMQGIYSITKAAVISMTQAFAKECAAWNVRVNAVLPGLTDTKFAAALTQSERMLRMILPLIPMERIAAPAEIAPAVAFLASAEASYITGVALPVDGGFLA